MKRVILSGLLSAAFFLGLGCYDGVFAHGKEKHGADPGDQGVTYSKNIRPLFNKKCAQCHGSKSPVHMEFVKDIPFYIKNKKGPRMDSYTYLTSFIVWPDTGSLMRALDDGKNTKDGKPGKMYDNLGKTEKEKQENLNLFKEWVGNWFLKEWSEIEKDDISAMKLAY